MALTSIKFLSASIVLLWLPCFFVGQEIFFPLYLEERLHLFDPLKVHPES